MTRISDDAFRQALAHPLTSTDLSVSRQVRGKARDNYSRNGERTIVVSDRISAFDRVLGTFAAQRSQVLNWIANWWFTKTKHIADNHVIRVPDPNVMVAVECTPLPVEMVVRAYLTGTNIHGAFGFTIKTVLASSAVTPYRTWPCAQPNVAPADADSEQ